MEPGFGPPGASTFAPKGRSGTAKLSAIERERRFPAEKVILGFDGSSRSYGQRNQTDEGG